MKKLFLGTIALLLPLWATAALGVYNVRDFGAKGDGKTLDSPAINAAIEAAVSDGGGQVVLPAGTYLSGSIRLKSNIDLHLSAGCTILAAPASMKAYDESESFGGFPEYQDGGHTYFHNSLIWAEGQTNVSITGHGMIDGKGLTKKDTEKAGNVQGGSIGTGDKAIALKLCRQVTIRDITIYRGGHFAIIMTGCDLSTIDNVTIDTNRDGFDIDCCKYMTITNCRINTPSDDALVLKSSYALKKPVLCEHIAVSNCNITGYKCGTLLDGTYVPEPVGWVCGRFKLGTESNGGYRNISLTNCTFTQENYYDYCSTAISVSGGSEVVVNSGSYTGEHALYVFSSGGVITVNDGTFVGRGNNGRAAIVAAIDTNTYPAYTGGLSISGGSISGGYEITRPAYMSITGGKFSNDPSEYVAEGYAAVGLAGGETYHYQVGKVVTTSETEIGSAAIGANTFTYSATSTVVDSAETTIGTLGTKEGVTVSGTTSENYSAVTTGSGITAAGAASLSQIKSTDLGTVVNSAISSAGAQASSVSSVKIVVVSDSGTETTDENEAVTSITYEVHPEAIAYVNNKAVSSVEIGNDQLASGASFTITLPVPDSIYTAAEGYNSTSPKVIVTHTSEDENYATQAEAYAIQGEAGAYYVEITVDHFSEFALEPDLTGTATTGNSVYACNLLLQGITKVQYALNLTDAIKGDENAYVVITMPNVNVSETIKVSEAQVNSTYKVFQFSVAAQYMDEDTYVMLYDGSGKHVAFDNTNVSSGTYAGGYLYGVYSYLNSNTVKNGNSYLQNLAESMKVYNKYAKYYFNPTTQEKPTYTLPSITADALSTYQGSSEGSVSGLSWYASNLQLKASTTVQIAYSGSVDGVTFSYELKDGETTHMSGELVPTANGNYWVVAVADIPAQYLDDTLTVTAVRDVETYTVTYSPFTYVANKLSSTTEGLPEVVKAFYAFNQAANAYFANK